jgi:hypothetical protein
MAGILYFLPKVALPALVCARGKISREILASCGLQEILADVTEKSHAALFDLSKAGPSGDSGTVLIPLPAKGGAPKRATYCPRLQTWQRVTDKLWIGLDKEYPPTPEDLERRAIRRGYKLPLSAPSPSSLHVPILRSPRGATSLPEDLSLDAAGELVVRVKESHRRLWEDAAPIWDFFIDRSRGELSRAEALRFAIRVLGVNYRFGLAEQHLLHWIDSDNLFEVLMLAVDVPAVEEFNGTQKKTPDAPAPACSKPSPGAPACGPGTSPAGESYGSPPCGEGAKDAGEEE